MSEILHIHPVSPQPRLIARVVEAVRNGQVIVYPTDTSYALGCRIGEKSALDRIRAIRELDERHNFTLACRDLSDISTYAKVNNQNYRLLKAYTPGPYTFILPATRQVPRMLQHPKRKTIGIRLPQHAITMALLEELDEPLMTTSLILPGDEYPLNDAEQIRERLNRQVDLIVDGGPSGSLEPSTVVDLAGDQPQVLREGAGDPTPFTAA
ncbi:MAG TPA: L-threonylcarbamoyladenylate synthase [Gammaproteobacteria bacterium]|nr:L-threonylcarbamoyladenylate synthase [Gammaproteobacteria bacterium]